MYLVGFYSPKAKSGVTELSLSIYQWLRTNTSLLVAFISYDSLEKETTSHELVHEFSKLSLVEQKRKIKEMKQEYDIVIYDASSQLSDDAIRLLPIVDRLFVIGEEHSHFAVKLYQTIEFSKIFNKRVKNFITHLQGNKTFIIQENKEGPIIGFNSTKKEVAGVGQMVYTDYVTHYLEVKLIEENKKIFTKIRQIPKEELHLGLYNLGIDFEKAFLFVQYIYLRELLGQSYNDALESLFPHLINSSFDELLEKFQKELYITSKLDG